MCSTFFCLEKKTNITQDPKPADGTGYADAGVTGTDYGMKDFLKVYHILE